MKATCAKLPYWLRDAYWMGWHKAFRDARMLDARIERNENVRRILVGEARHNNRMLVGYLRLMRGLS